MIPELRVDETGRHGTIAGGQFDGLEVALLDRPKPSPVAPPSFPWRAIAGIAFWLVVLALVLQVLLG